MMEISRGVNFSFSNSNIRSEKKAFKEEHHGKEEEGFVTRLMCIDHIVLQ